MLFVQKLFTPTAPPTPARPSTSGDCYQASEGGSGLPRFQDMLKLVRPADKPDAAYNTGSLMGHAGELLEGAKHAKGLDRVLKHSSLLNGLGTGANKILNPDQDHANLSRLEGAADLADSVHGLGEKALKNLPAAEKVLGHAGRFIGPVGHGVAFLQRGADLGDSFHAQQQLGQNRKADQGLIQREQMAQNGRMLGMGASAALEGVATGLSIWGPPGALAGTVVGAAAFGVEMGTRALTDDADELRKKGLLS